MAKSVKALITSWNMGNAESKGEETLFTQKDNFDIVCLGLQESTYANADCVAIEKAKFITCLGDEFYLVQHCQRAQLQMFVFARQELQEAISDVDQSVENTGFLHLFPNKGGLLVTMTIHGTKIAFISCHLTAHEGVKHCEARNQSIIEILGGVRAGDPTFDVAEQYHHVFWMGDMNYRITDDPSVPALTKKNAKNYELPQVAYANKSMYTSKNGDESPRGGGAPRTNSGPKDGKTALSVEDVDVEAEILPDALCDDGSDVESDMGEGEEEEVEGKAEKNKARALLYKNVTDMIVAEQWDQLLAMDELNREIASGRVLNGFVPLQPHWPPTFKRTRDLIIPSTTVGKKTTYHLTPGPAAGSRRGSTGGSTKKSDAAAAATDRNVYDYYHIKRLPSYTDRILYKSLPAFQGKNLQTLFFESVEGATSSDHKPVQAGFEIRLCGGKDDIRVDSQLLDNVKNSEFKLSLTITNLRGENLEEMDSQAFGGKSDPYVVITTDPGELLLTTKRLCKIPGNVKTSVISHDVNPVWKESIPLTLASLDLKGLSRNVSLILAVWDYDKFNEDDLIGVMTVPLKAIIDAHINGAGGEGGGGGTGDGDGAYNFSESLHSNSEVMGKLMGTIKINGDMAEILKSSEFLRADNMQTAGDRFDSLKALLPRASDSAGGGCCSIS